MVTVPELLGARPSIVNIGLRSFADNLASMGADCVHVDWQPPVQGDPGLARKLAALDEYAGRIAEANREAVSRILAARPVWKIGRAHV